MAKLKEYPAIISDLFKDILQGNIEAFTQKCQNGVLYFLDKTLEPNSIIRYIIWKHSNYKNKPRITVLSPMNFALIYFYNDKFNQASYSRLLKCIKTQLNNNCDIFIINKNYAFREINLSSYSHICFIEQHDMISTCAFDEISRNISDRDPDIIYSDEDIINRFGFRTHPYFKPQYAPLLLLTHNYMNAFLCLKLNDIVVDELENIKKITQNSIYKLVLSLTRRGVKSYRIPNILYHRHWKNAKRIENSSTIAIIEDEIKQRNLNAKVQNHNKEFNQVKFFPTQTQKVSIIIPFKDKLSLLQQCLESIEQRSTYHNYEIILVNNNSKDFKTLEYLQNTNHKVLNANIEFNFSKINNMAVNIATGEYVILLNNDTKIITPNWIENMLALAQLPQIGAVSPKLLFENNKLQHSGIVVRDNAISHIDFSLENNQGKYRNYMNIVREYSCLTGACLMISKQKYNQVQGLTEELAVEWNDIEFCLKLLRAGYYNVYTPYSVIYHYEKMTRKTEFKYTRIQELNYMSKHWWNSNFKDPYYNPNFSKKRNDFSIRISFD